MDMTLVRFIRKHGWLDMNGNMQYGNAAVLCYLKSSDNLRKLIMKQYGTIRIADLDPAIVAKGCGITEKLLKSA